MSELQFLLPFARNSIHLLFSGIKTSYTHSSDDLKTKDIFNIFFPSSSQQS